MTASSSGRQRWFWRKACQTTKGGSLYLYPMRHGALSPTVKAPELEPGTAGIGAEAGSSAGVPGRLLRVLALVPDAFGSCGGIAKFNRDLLTAICAQSGCAEVVAVPRLMPESPGSLPGKLTWITDGLGGKLRYVAAVLKSLRRRRPAGALRRASTVDPQLSASFDLLICGHINLLPAAFLARKLMRPAARSGPGAPCPLVLILHGLDVWEPHRSLLVRSLARRVDAFISVSTFTRDRFLRWARVPAGKGFSLPNCVDLTGFEPGEKNPELLKRYGLDGRKVLMTLGRLLPGRPKGIDEVLELLPELAREEPQIAYLIAGDGPDRNRLAAKAVQLGVGDRVAFAGRVPESEKAAHYRLADAFVMPGYGEGFGIVYLEALACGIPVLASTLDASREALLDGEMGLLVDPRNRAELRRELLRVLRQPRGGVPPRLEYFSFPSFARRCQAIVERLCPAGGGCP
jgi:glycosyltransferase involved in cell wall biosynthesis